MLHAENRVSFEMFFSNVGRHRYGFRVQLETVKNKKEFIIFSLPAIISMSIIIAAIISHELDLLEARQAHDLSITPNQIVKEKDLRYEQLEKQNEETRHSITLLQQFMEKQFPGSFPPSA
ncbi:uncharacterized protein LOC110229779 [Arabidopsis lyrata subsp. lyrata]|uniref:uncharacterized protein LOC110229779 n=1 Tax=Arabidopsis lyrata subsp. lyrata TaxID=81972 RepID=UPI000A29E4AC|nr:uncharacterized protein LOC110229779 [Arabidopsis lyrata subsp. lyrata]|eukprot:XP_020886274.1 uncharacterized protein LOC110229779 [Arabidopsis lyrata subsp. lyrata]